MLQIASINNRQSNDYLPMSGSEGLGQPLVSNAGFGADYLLFGVEAKTSLHIHAADHILIIHQNTGWLEFDGQTYYLEPGICYLVPGMVPHRITAGINGLGLYAISNAHKCVDSVNRLEIISE